MVQWQETNVAPGLSQHAATGILVHDGGGTAWGTGVAGGTVDGGVTASDHFSVGDYVLDANGAIVGKFKSATGDPATALTLEANNTVAISDNGAIHKRTPLILKNTSGQTQSMTLLLLVA
tara:strand:- start:53 stop:412 length:360 start_codon:yes stop_codon:yes gene_type:complete